ncbi:MAG: hypothetical protein JWN11_2606 [Hyphomicrobiales bacterium]|nr:hypothetical protein [Hyphomicrobiales bacterium]
MSRDIMILILSAAFLILGNGGAFSSGPAVIDVALSDKDASAAMGVGLDMGHPGADMSMASLKIEATPQVVAAGAVTFKVKNISSSMIHEMIVAKLLDSNGLPPYDKATGKVDEAAVASLGEVPELDPGMSGTLSLDLEPGTYVLFCNLPGHYMAGMWSSITVR